MLMTAIRSVRAARPPHLQGPRYGYGALPEEDLDEICGNENRSIDAKDIFGESPSSGEPYEDHFDPLMDNPFKRYVRECVAALGSAAIRPEDEADQYDTIPLWRVHQDWLSTMAGGDRWAMHAIEGGFANLRKMPNELYADEARAQRIEWLAAKVPASERQRIERRDAEIAAMDLDF